MPFDGTEFTGDLILERLLEARAKFTGPESWFKFGNEPFNVGENTAVHCIGTALGSFSDTPAANFLLGLAGCTDKSVGLASWNNAPNYLFPNEHRTYEDVIELLDRAIEKRRPEIAKARELRLADIMAEVAA